MTSTAQPSDTIPSKRIQPVARPAEGKATAWRSGRLVGLCVGLSVGVVVWLLVERFYPVFANEGAKDQWGFLPVDLQWELDRNNSMFVLALLGGVFGAVLAVTEGVCRRSWKTALAAGVACGVSGAAFGGLAAFLGLIVFEFYRANAEISDLAKASQVYAVMFGTLGAGVGLAAGACLGRSVRATIRYLAAGLWAGILASPIYLVIVALAMPAVLTSVLIPTEAGERLVWFGVAAGLLGVFIPSVAGRQLNRGPG